MLILEMILSVMDYVKIVRPKSALSKLVNMSRIQIKINESPTIDA